MASLSYGDGRLLPLARPAVRTLGDRDRGAGEFTRDVAAAVETALRAPEGYPPLAAALTEGDSVAIAVGPHLPHQAEMVAAVLEHLRRRRVADDQISILYASAESASPVQTPAADRELTNASGPRSEVHDPTFRDHLAYLAADTDARPIYLHRWLTDADVVISLNATRSPGARDNLGPAGEMFPTFSDQATQFRCTSPAVLYSRQKRRRLRRDVREAAWLLGSVFHVQATPGIEDQAAVVAGDADSATAKSRQYYLRQWAYPAGPREPLVVAGLGGSEDSQTWEGLGRALTAARHLTARGGAIALCSELSATPGLGMQLLAANDDLDDVEARLLKHNPPDAVAALQLAAALRRNKVYLLSRLKPDLVEDLGMTPLESAAELDRLVRRAPRFVSIENAQYVAIRRSLSA